MKINPIIPIWLMAVICIVTALLVILRKKTTTLLRQLLLLVLLFVINLRVMVPNGNVTSYEVSRKLNVLFVIDTTFSMNALDYDEDWTPRMDAVKADCIHIIEELKGAKFSIVTFDNDAIQKIPFTSDSTFAISMIKALRTPVSYQAWGSSFDDCVKMTEDVLKTVSESSDEDTVIFFISDGELNAGSEKSFKGSADYITDGAVMGYGTEKGGKMYYDEESDSYLYDYESSGDALSKIDETVLKNVADDMDIEYIHMTEQSKIDDVLDRIASSSEEEADGTTKELKDYDDTYYILVYLVIVLLAFEFISYRKESFA